MSDWFDKWSNLTILDYILVATIGGLAVLGATFLINFIYQHISKKHSRKIKRMIRSLKYKNIKEAFLRRKILKLDYDEALYNLVSNDEFKRFLYPNERKYLKKHKAAHKEQRRNNAKVYENIIVRSPTPWK